MSREIKFRAYQDGEILTSPISSNYGLARFFGMLYEDTIVMQYTGLKDKNGKEIFEGDILQWVSSNPFSKGEIRKVKVSYVEARFWCQGTIGVYLAELLANEKCEIIGNIYQNPELLTK